MLKKPVKKYQRKQEEKSLFAKIIANNPAPTSSETHGDSSRKRGKTNARKRSAQTEQDPLSTQQQTPPASTNKGAAETSEVAGEQKPCGAARGKKRGRPRLSDDKSTVPTSTEQETSAPKKTRTNRKGKTEQSTKLPHGPQQKESFLTTNAGNVKKDELDKIQRNNKELQKSYSLQTQYEQRKVYETNKLHHRQQQQPITQTIKLSSKQLSQETISGSSQKTTEIAREPRNARQKLGSNSLFHSSQPEEANSEDSDIMIIEKDDENAPEANLLEAKQLPHQRADAIIDRLITMNKVLASLLNFK